MLAPAGWDHEEVAGTRLAVCAETVLTDLPLLEGEWHRGTAGFGVVLRCPGPASARSS